jgi:hypothetical protein
MFRGDGILAPDVDARYAAFRLTKTECKVEADLVKNIPQSYG